MAVNRYDDTLAWYTISTYSGYEDKVAESIKQRLDRPEFQDKILDAIVPKEKQIEIKNGKRKIVASPMKLGTSLETLQASPALLAQALNQPQFPKKKSPKSRSVWVSKIQNTPSTMHSMKLSPSLTVLSRDLKARSLKSIPLKASSRSWFPCLAAKRQSNSTLFRLKRLAKSQYQQFITT